VRVTICTPMRDQRIRACGLYTVGHGVHISQAYIDPILMTRQTYPYSIGPNMPVDKLETLYAVVSLTRACVRH